MQNHDNVTKGHSSETVGSKGKIAMYLNVTSWKRFIHKMCAVFIELVYPQILNICTNNKTIQYAAYA